MGLVYFVIQSDTLIDCPSGNDSRFLSKQILVTLQIIFKGTQIFVLQHVAQFWYVKLVVESDEGTGKEISLDSAGKH